MSKIAERKFGTEGTLRASWDWFEHGFMEIPYTPLTLKATRPRHNSSQVTIWGLSGNEGECITFDLFDLLDAIAVEIGPVSVAGTRACGLLRRPKS